MSHNVAYTWERGGNLHYVGTIDFNNNIFSRQ
jgi:hypothetical protein